MDIELIFKVAGVGIIVSVLNVLLKRRSVTSRRL